MSKSHQVYVDITGKTSDKAMQVESIADDLDIRMLKNNDDQT